MAKRIPDKKRRAEACKKETLEDALEYLLEEYDLKGANPYTRERGKFTLVQLVAWLENHDELANKTPRRRSDIVRNVLNEMMSMIRVGSTRKARYSYDSEGGSSEAREILDAVLVALLQNGGDVGWKELQALLKIDEEGGIATHLEFNSAVNYLVDNGVVEKVGLRADRERNEKGVREIRGDSRRVICTAKAWGWETGLVTDSPDKSMDLYDSHGEAFGSRKGWLAEDSGVQKIGGSTKKTHSIALTARTSFLLDELGPILNALPNTDKKKPANINRSTIVEVALWTLYRQIEYFEGRTSDEVTPLVIAQQLVEMSPQQRVEVSEKLNELAD